MSVLLCFVSEESSSNKAIISIKTKSICFAFSSFSDERFLLTATAEVVMLMMMRMLMLLSNDYFTSTTQKSTQSDQLKHKTLTN